MLVQDKTNSASDRRRTDIGGQRLAKVVSVSTSDIGGGAERMAWILFKSLQQRGIESWMVVGDKKTDDPHVMPFFQSPHINYAKYASGWYPAWLRWRKRTDTARGRDDFHFPYSKYLPSITGSKPDIIHCHNLHGGYFDLRVLSDISHRIPVWLSLHDCWNWTGQCAYSLDCDHRETRCGCCPTLSLPAAKPGDASRYNWRRKRDIYRRCRFHVTGASKWIMDEALSSILAPAIVDHRIIPNAVDLDTFKPVACRQQVRQRLAIPREAFVVMFSAHQTVSNPFKDYATMRKAVAHLANRYPQRNIEFLAVGEAGPDQFLGSARVKHIPFQPPNKLAEYYRASDVYIHAAKAEVFGMVIAEAMACGLPVVATAVGGIPEVFTDNEHGFLVPPGDAAQMASMMGRFIQRPALGSEFGERAARHAKMHYDKEIIVDQYLDWYRSVCEQGAA